MCPNKTQNPPSQPGGPQQRLKFASFFGGVVGRLRFLLTFACPRSGGRASPTSRAAMPPPGFQCTHPGFVHGLLSAFEQSPFSGFVSRFGRIPVQFYVRFCVLYLPRRRRRGLRNGGRALRGSGARSAPLAPFLVWLCGVWLDRGHMGVVLFSSKRSAAPPKKNAENPPLRFGLAPPSQGGGRTTR